MKRIGTIGLLCMLSAMAAIAQPANNSCSTAQTVAATSCVSGTTTGADDSWVGSVGCQSGGNHNDVWYRFVATQNQLNINVTGSGIGNNIEFILAESPCGTCACSFTIAGDACGPSPLIDSIVGLNVGSTYYYTISSSGSDGGFTSCITSVPAVNIPGQDCSTASNICNRDPFGQGSIASGNGAINGLGSQEDVNTLSCFGSSERQSQWYRFTASNTGTIEFNINPIVSSDDYDFLLLDITTSGCNLLSGPATVVACNWSGCKGSTGISSAVALEPGLVTSGAGCFGGPAAWVTTPPTITACRNYLLLIDNFSLSNNGFNFTWGGASSGMTATIGPEGIVGFTPTVVTTSPCVVSIGGVQNRACYNYQWTWGDGTTSTGPTPPNHTYAAGGTYTITQTITDANGCVATTSRTISCVLPEEEIMLSGRPTHGAVNLQWTVPTHIRAQGFILQHSPDGANFTDFAMPTATEARNGDGYAGTHAAPVAGMNFYRVIAKDWDGNLHPSDRLLVRYDADSPELVIWPNPANAEVDVAYQVPQDGRVRLELMDVQGKRLQMSENEVPAGQHTSRFDLASLRSGIYFVKVTAPGSVQVRSFTKQ